jgi:hypothetical protein
MAVRITRAPVVALAALVLVGSCAIGAQRRAAEHTEIQKQAAQEVRRVCALPPAQRDAELERINKESGIVVQCGNE